MARTSSIHRLGPDRLPRPPYVWEPARKTSSMKITPHDLRHSWITHMRAAGVDDADLAEMAGHTVATMLGTYSHPLGKSFDQVRRVVG